MIATPLSHAKRKFKRCERFVFADDLTPALQARLSEVGMEVSCLIGVYRNSSDNQLTRMICFMDHGIVAYDSSSPVSIPYSEMVEISMTPGSELTAGSVTVRSDKGNKFTLSVVGFDESSGADDTYDIYMFLQAVAKVPE